MRTKYIIFDDGSGLLYPVIFPELQEHFRIAMKIGDKPVSAGFVNLSNNKANVYGKSVGLSIEAKQEDNQIISNYLFPQ